MFGNFFEWVTDWKIKDKVIHCYIPNYRRPEGIHPSKAFDSNPEQNSLNEVSSENPYYFSETTSDRKYYNDSPVCSGVYPKFLKDEINEI